MCALILLHRCISDFPVVLAANRDELYARLAEPPALVLGRIPYVAPKDLAAGGTWIGTNAAGLVAAVTNRPTPAVDPALPSRGALVREVLAFGSAAAARIHVEQAFRGQRMNGFHLLIADEHDAYVVRGGNGEFRTVRLGGRCHVVTNLHELDALQVPVAAELARAEPAPSLLEAVAILGEALRSSAPLDATGFALSKRHGDRGTRSSTILARGPLGSHGGLFLHADGPPADVPYADYGHLLRALAAP